MKRLFLLFFSALLCTAVSAHDFEVDGIYYKITSSSYLTVEVTYRGSYSDSYSNEYSGSVVIPEKVTYNGKEYSVTSIGEDAFWDCSGLKSVTIPNSVTSIGDAAFIRCSGLTSVTIPNSVTSIGEYAFEGCSGLTSVTIPNSVTSIENRAFIYCSGLTSVTIPNSVTSIGEDAFSGCSGLTTIEVESGNTKYDSRDNCNAIIETNTNTLIVGCKNTVIPNSVTSIGDEAFSGCSGLTSVTIPNSVTSIGESAFSGCSGLTSVTIPNSVTSIGESAFSGCSGLTSVTIPNSVTSIGENAFRGCSALTAVHITDLSAWCKIQFYKELYSGEYNNPTYYAHHLYLNGEEITNLVIPDDVTSIGDAAFIGCYGLTSVTIPNSVTSIGNSAFDGCSGLTSVTIPNSVTSIGYRVFYGCSGLTSVTIPNSVTSIGYEAFRACSGLTSINIPNSVTSIESSAFRDCSALTSVTIPNSVTSIEYEAFRACSGLTSVTIGSSVTSIGSEAFYKCSGLKAVHITDLSAWCKIKFSSNDSNPTYYAHHLYLNGEEITNLVIPDDVTSIGKHVFYGCSGLTSVTIPNSVTSIGNDAFYNCSGLTAVHITDLSAWYKITFGDEYANPMYNSSEEVTYVNDMELTDLTIPDSITAIHEYAFIGCNSLRRLTIPESCKTVPQYAFRGCNNLQELTLPSTCIACYDYSFYGCSSLKNINSKAETPPAVYAHTFSSSIYTKATLNVPEGSADKYKAANIWKEFTNMTVGGVVPDEPKQCAAPVIKYADGKLQFACETEGAEYRYTLTDTDIKSVYTDVTNSAVNLSACYTIKAYAYAVGYTNSEQVTATLYWINGSDVSTNINQTEMRGVMATCSGGIITVSGLSDGETVMFYDANGALLYTGSAQNGTISYAPSASGVIIVKIGTVSIKVVN